MSTFPISVVNPAITKGPTNIIYAGSAKANTLDVTIENKFAFPLTIKKSDTLTITFPSTFFTEQSEGNVKKITLDSAWTKPTVTPPAANSNDPFVLTTTAVNDIQFAQGGCLKITLSNIEPTSANNGPLGVKHVFSSVTMNPSTNLVCDAVQNPDYQTLMGANRALSVDIEIEGNSAGSQHSNKIEPTVTPQTGHIQPADVVYNSVKVAFAFKGENNTPKSSSGYNPKEELIEAQGSTSPSIKITFPYVNEGSDVNQAFALTDNPAKKNDYISPTSGRNIQISLSSTELKTSDSYWTITTDVTDTTTAPAWYIKPTTTNKHVFTSISGTGPGPFLNLYLSKICTSLPIDPLTPDSVIQIQSKDFPGFNTQMYVDTVPKDPAQKTKSFSVAVTPTRTDAYMQWQTQNTTTVTITGVDAATGQLDPSGPISAPISVQNPLLCRYDLATFCANRTPPTIDTGNGFVTSNWALNPTVIASGYGQLSVACASPDASSVYMPAQGADTQPQLHQLSCDTLASIKETNFTPVGTGSKAQVFAPINVTAPAQGDQLYVLRKGQNTTQQNQNQLDIVKLDTSDLSVVGKPFTGLPMTGQMLDGGGLSATPDGSHVVYSRYLAAETPTIYYLDTTQDWSSYTPPTVPVSTLNNRGLAVTSQTIYHSDSGGLGYVALSPSLGSTSQTKTLQYMGSNFETGPMCLTQDHSQLAVWALPQGLTTGARIFLIKTLNLTVETNSIATVLSYVPASGGFNGYFMPDITYSADGRYLFVSGVGSAAGNGLIYTYDVTTGAQVGATIQTAGSGFSSIVTQPNGLGIFPLFFGSSLQGGVQRLDPTFAPFENPNS